MQFIIFSVDHSLLALDISYVERVVRAAEMTPAPTGSKNICGIINIYGTAYSVISLRSLLKEPIRDIELSDQFICCSFEGRKCVLWVDKVHEMRDISEDTIISADALAIEHKSFRQLIKDKEHFILVFNFNEAALV